VSRRGVEKGLEGGFGESEPSELFFFFRGALVRTSNVGFLPKLRLTAFAGAYQQFVPTRVSFLGDQYQQGLFSF
jgi:hypothetical protein